MRKFFRILGYLFLGLIGILVLSINGFPKPERIEARNIKKASFGQITDIMGLMSYQLVSHELIRSEGK